MVKSASDTFLSQTHAPTHQPTPKNLCKRYGLEDPLIYLAKDPPTRSFRKELITTKITAYFERELRTSAANNSAMIFFNTYQCNLRGRHHPAICNMVTSWDVKRSRAHLKMLSGNYLTYQVKAAQSGGSPRCRICEIGPVETISHVLSTCSGLESERNKLLIELRNLCYLTQNNLDLDHFMHSETVLSQFILDPASLNLSLCVNPQDPVISEFYKLSRDFCYVLDKARIRLLSALIDSKL